MSGDFTRWTFDGRKRYRAVLQQQGRVTLDADVNEQAAIDSARADFLGATTIGPVGRPKGEFVVTITDKPPKATVDNAGNVVTK